MHFNPTDVLRRVLHGDLVLWPLTSEGQDSHISVIGLAVCILLPVSPLAVSSRFVDTQAADDGQ